MQIRFKIPNMGEFTGKLSMHSEICFICGKPIQGTSKYMLGTVTSSLGISLPTKISAIIGDRFVIFVSKDDKVCIHCLNLIEELDELESQIIVLKRKVLELLETRYDMSFDRNSKNLDNEMIIVEDRDDVNLENVESLDSNNSFCSSTDTTKHYHMFNSIKKEFSNDKKLSGKKSNNNDLLSVIEESEIPIPSCCELGANGGGPFPTDVGHSLVSSLEPYHTTSLNVVKPEAGQTNGSLVIAFQSKEGNLLSKTKLSNHSSKDSQMSQHNSHALEIIEIGENPLSKFPHQVKAETKNLYDSEVKATKITMRKMNYSSYSISKCRNNLKAENHNSKRKCGVDNTDIQVCTILQDKTLIDTGTSRFETSLINGSTVLQDNMENYNTENTIFNGDSLGNHSVEEVVQCGKKSVPINKNSCTRCGKEFKRKTQLDNHNLYFHGPKKCRICGKHILDIVKLRQHEHRHARFDKQKLICDTCGHTFKTPTGLRIHKVSHTGNYKFFCEYCGKGFMSPVILEEHKGVHTKEEKYMCDVCGKKFIHYSSLHLHKQWHNNPFPYPCRMCTRKFKYSSERSNHIRKDHTGEQPHKCPHCVAKFLRSSYLKRHLIAHTKQYPFICELCNKGFYQRKGLAKHVNAHNDKTVNDN